MGLSLFWSSWCCCVHPRTSCAAGWRGVWLGRVQLGRVTSAGWACGAASDMCKYVLEPELWGVSPLLASRLPRRASAPSVHPPFRPSVMYLVRRRHAMHGPSCCLCESTRSRLADAPCLLACAILAEPSALRVTACVACHGVCCARVPPAWVPILLLGPARRFPSRCADTVDAGLTNLHACTVWCVGVVCKAGSHAPHSAALVQGVVEALHLYLTSVALPVLSPVGSVYAVRLCGVLVTLSSLPRSMPRAREC